MLSLQNSALSSEFPPDGNKNFTTGIVRIEYLYNLEIGEISLRAITTHSLLRKFKETAGNAMEINKIYNTTIHFSSIVEEFFPDRDIGQCEIRKSILSSSIWKMYFWNKSLYSHPTDDYLMNQWM